jgi:hypothetical protein
MIRTSICAYPWDIIGDHGAAERFAALVAGSAGTVTLAAAYHGVRAATPQHASHRFVDAPHSALYLPVREDHWKGHRLRPASSAAWTGDDDAFGTARSALTAAGVPTAAWVVLTHNDPIGFEERQDDLRVRTAFGDSLTHALCPSSDDVLTYCVALVSEVAATGVGELMLEAVSQLGFEHGGGHEKTAGADWSAVDVALLSICCCGSCATLLGGKGVDVDVLATVIRGAVGSGAVSLEEALGEFAEPVLALRQWTTTRLLNAVTSAARSLGVARISAHAGLDPWATSSFSHLGPGVLPLDAVVLSDATVTALSPSSITTLRAEGGASVAGYVSALAPVAAESFVARWGALVESGVDELVVYHGGLISARRAAAVAAALDHVSRARRND